MDYSKLLSDKVQDIKPSGIRKFFDMLSEMKDVVGLTVGQPDFPTPYHISNAAVESITKNKTYYTSNSGLIELREGIADYLNRRFDLHYNPVNEVFVTVGGSEAIDMALRAIINPGDEVIVPEPCFVCYSPLIEIMGGVAVPLYTSVEEGFKVTPEKLRPLLSDKTKALVLSYPNNPTGAIMTKEDLERIVPDILARNMLVLSDEIYGELTYGREHVSIASLDGMRERTIVVSGFSKAYAMTGWRLGYAAAPKELIAQMLKLHQYGIMCASTASQFAGLEAIINGDADIQYMKEQYDFRRTYVVKRLHEMGVECFVPEGAFYVFPRIDNFGMTSEEFCSRMLEEKRVAIVPGSAFGSGSEGFARISYAYSIEHLTIALDRMEEFIKDIK
ncbi:MAG: aminotransferase class I/II-fold pyridoxal phosphate-dependent enzyme [Clostridia bacterium]|nr:aminotransferase class I/II-fold pyridoxal phosphate-dependent enzyme [Clostridia bacterium]MBQ6614164.1 aminotransferase class I/II-fold pyridoxal phosphate-dependent enzyme [Clostridia bacterium]